MLQLKQLAMAIAILVVSSQYALAQKLPTITIGDLALPVTNPVIVQTIIERKLDAKHGFVLEARRYPSIASFYAGLATGEVDTLIAGTTMIAKLRLEGAPVKLASTVLSMSHIAILTADPAIRRFEDLKGKQLAADMGAQQYQAVAMYAQSKGLAMRKDITVVPANFPLARSLLSAGRVDAALIIEPVVTEELRSKPNLRSIFNGDQAWKEMTGRHGWDLALAVREDFTKRQPDGARRLMGALADVAKLMTTNIDDVDRIAVEKAKFARGVLKEAVANKRYQFEIHPAWEGERKTLMEMIESAVVSKFIERVPQDVIYQP